MAAPKIDLPTPHARGQGPVRRREGRAQRAIDEAATAFYVVDDRIEELQAQDAATADRTLTSAHCWTWARASSGSPD